jgi:preprotein translocase subunit SecG
MYQVIIVVHVLLGLGVIGLILMQQGKGADAGAAFGSGSSGSVFGAQGAASFLSRTTAILATLFFSTSLTLAVLNGQQSKSTDLMDSVEVEQKTTDVPLATKPAAPTVQAVPAVTTTVPATEITAPAVAVSTEKSATTTATPIDNNPANENSKDKSAAVDKDNKVDENEKAADTVVSKSEEKHAEKKAESKKKSHSDKKDSDKHTKKHDSDKKDK